MDNAGAVSAIGSAIKSIIRTMTESTTIDDHNSIVRNVVVNAIFLYRTARCMFCLISFGGAYREGSLAYVTTTTYEIMRMK